MGVGGGVYLGAEVGGDLDGGLSHPSGAGVDEYVLARGQVSGFDQGQIRGQKRCRYRRGLGMRPPRGNGDHHAFVGDRGGCESVVGEQPHHRITGAHPGHVGGGVDHHSGGFSAEALLGDGAQRDHHIMEVQPGRADVHADLSRSEFGVGVAGLQGQAGQIALTGGR